MMKWHLFHKGLTDPPEETSVPQRVTGFQEDSCQAGAC